MKVKNGMRPIHPGEILYEDFMKPMKMDFAGVAKAAGLDAEFVRNLVIGQVSVTPQVAQSLARWLGTSSQSWLNLQATYDERKRGR